LDIWLDFWNTFVELKNKYIMKKIITLLAVVGMLGFQGCSGPEGPPGPPGYDGQDGLIADAIEITNVSFTASNSFGIFKAFAKPIFDSDMVLVYRLSSVVNGVDVWSLVPETHYFNNGTLDFSYDFDFTRNDVNIFMVGGNLGTVADQFRLNQIFRIVVLPANLINGIDKNNYNAVMSTLKINESQIQKIDL
jgi:hypothetical protein